MLIPILMEQGDTLRTHVNIQKDPGSCWWGSSDYHTERVGL
jgi:hypothetical protein